MGAKPLIKCITITPSNVIPIFNYLNNHLKSNVEGCLSKMMYIELDIDWFIMKNHKKFIFKITYVLYYLGNQKFSFQNVLLFTNLNLFKLICFNTCLNILIFYNHIWSRYRKKMFYEDVIYFQIYFLNVSFLMDCSKCTISCILTWVDVYSSYKMCYFQFITSKVNNDKIYY